MTDEKSIARRKKREDRKRERDRKIERERRMILRLQRDHGYFLGEMPRKDERFTTHFAHDRRTGRTTIVAARVIRVSFPTGSWLAKAIQPVKDSAPKRQQAKKLPARKKISERKGAR